MLSHCSRVNIKRRMRNTNIKSSKFIKIITKGLVVTLQPGQRQKKDEEQRHQISKKTPKSSPKALLSHLKGQHQKKDEEHKHQNHQNHHQRSCCHIAAGSTSKEDEENTNIKSSKIIKIITKGLVVTLQPGQHQKKDEENTNIKSSKFIKIITKGLVVTLQPGQHQKKDENTNIK